MLETEEITQKPDFLRFESYDKSFLTQYVVLQDGVVMCYAYGNVDLQGIKDAHEHLIVLLDHFKKGRNQPFDMIIDFNNVKWIDKNARAYLKSAFSTFFETGQLRHLGVISDSLIVRTMGGLWAKLNPLMNFTFYKNEISAYQEILKKKVNSAKQSSEISIAQDLLKENIIFYRGLKLLLYKKKEWQYNLPKGKLAITLINSKILHISMSGEVNNALVDHCIKCIVEAHDLLNKEKLDLIFEISQIHFPSVNVRKIWFNKTEEIKDIWEMRFIVANPMISALFKIERTANPEFLERTDLVDSVSHALDKLLNLGVEHFKEMPKSRKTEDDYDSFSKKQLIEEIRLLKSTQGERINQLFELLSKTNVDQEYKPKSYKLPENDSFSDLFNAVNVVQHDFFEMVHELKNLNQNLEQKVNERTFLLNTKNQELVQLNDELDHFVYCVSHDLRAPLSSIQGLINLMKMESEVNKEQYLDLVSKNIRRLDLFIQEILQLSRNARLVIAKEIIDFQKIIDNTFAELVYLIESGGIQKTIYIEQETPFESDSHRITIIFRNLLSNAIKYSMNKHKVPTLNIRIKSDKEKAVLEISDNGMGIMKEHIEKVFDMFYRATDVNAGSGLGLYIVKQVVTKLDGEIQLESEVGVGTKVMIVLPNLNEK